MVIPMLWDFSYGFKQAVFIFPILAFIITLPFLAYQYSKYGSVHIWRSIILYSFVFYLLVAFFLVILPLPSREYVSQMTTRYTQFKPFFFIDLFRNRGLIHNGLPAWIAFIQTTTFQQVFFNVLLFVPFGVYMRYYFKHGFFITLVLSFGLSLFFELTQLSALYGFYPRPYRIFDVDDLILNTLGGIIGFIITPLIVFMFPSRTEMDEISYSKASEVGMGRRIVAVIIDGLLMMGIGVIALIGVRSDLSLLELVSNPLSIARKLINHYDLMILSMGLACLFMILQVWMFKGKTVGKALVHLKLVTRDDKRPQFLPIFLRYGVIFIEFSVLFGSLALVVLTRNVNQTNLNQPLIGLLILFMTSTLLMFDILGSFFTKSPMFHERMSRITNIAY